MVGPSGALAQPVLRPTSVVRPTVSLSHGLLLPLTLGQAHRCASNSAVHRVCLGAHTVRSDIDVPDADPHRGAAAHERRARSVSGSVGSNGRGSDPQERTAGKGLRHKVVCNRLVLSLAKGVGPAEVELQARPLASLCLLYVLNVVVVELSRLWKLCNRRQSNDPLRII